MEGNAWNKPFRPGPRLFDQPTAASPMGGASPFKLPQRRSRDVSFGFMEEEQSKSGSNQAEEKPKPSEDSPSVETEVKEPTGPFKFPSRKFLWKDDNIEQKDKEKRKPVAPSISLQFPIATSEPDDSGTPAPPPTDTTRYSDPSTEMQLERDVDVVQFEPPPEEQQLSIERRTQPETPEPRPFSLPRPEQRLQETPLTEGKKLFSLGRLGQEHSPVERGREPPTGKVPVPQEPLRERKKPSVLPEKKLFEVSSAQAPETVFVVEQEAKVTQRPETPVTPVATEYRKKSPGGDREKVIPRRRDPQGANLGFSKPSFQMPNLQGPRLGPKKPNLTLPKRPVPTPVSSPLPTPLTPQTPQMAQMTRMPQTPQTPQMTQMPQTPQTPQMTQMPQTPQTPTILFQPKTPTTSPPPAPQPSKPKPTLDLLAFSHETRKPHEPAFKVQKMQAKPFSSMVEERRDTRFRAVKIDEEKEANQRKQMEHCAQKREEYENYFISKRQDFTKQIEEMNEMLEESTEKLKEQAVRLYMLNNECLFMDSPVLRDQIKQLGKKLQEFSIQEETGASLIEKIEE